MAAPIASYYAPEGAATAFYDLVTDGDRALAGDIDHYARLAGGRATVLELGAGTGRVAIALAGRGLAVTGLDRAAAMLAQAEAKRAALPAEVAARLRFVPGDLTALALGRRFDAIFATYFTLAHVPTASWAKAFRGIARHLAPGGIVGLHLPIPERMGEAPPPPDVPVFARMLADGGALTLYVAGKSFDSRVGRMELLVDYVVRGPDGMERRRSRERLTYHAGDPAPFAERVGLRPAGAAIPVGGAGFIHMFAN